MENPYPKAENHKHKQHPFTRIIWIHSIILALACNILYSNILNAQNSRVNDIEQAIELADTIVIADTLEYDETTKILRLKLVEVILAETDIKVGEEIEIINGFAPPPRGYTYYYVTDADGNQVLQGRSVTLRDARMALLLSRKGLNEDATSHQFEFDTTGRASAVRFIHGEACLRPGSRQTPSARKHEINGAHQVITRADLMYRLRHGKEIEKLSQLPDAEFDVNRAVELLSSENIGFYYAEKLVKRLDDKQLIPILKMEIDVIDPIDTAAPSPYAFMTRMDRKPLRVRLNAILLELEEPNPELYMVFSALLEKRPMHHKDILIALGLTGDQAIDLLNHELNHGEQVFSAAQALGRIGSAHAKKTLIDKIKYDSQARPLGFKPYSAVIIARYWPDTWETLKNEIKSLNRYPKDQNNYLNTARRMIQQDQMR